MERPIVNLIQDQRVETNDVQIDNWEAEQLLRKYGYQPQQFTNQTKPEAVQSPGLTFEEAIMQEEYRRKQDELKRSQQRVGPKPITYGHINYNSEVKYKSDDDTGFSFKIEITSDMKLPNY